MPQPLLKVAPNATVFIGNNDDSPAVKRPNLALRAMHVMAQWSILESFMSALFVAMLGANPRPGAAMYSSLTSTASQKAALRAVADTNLTPEHNEIFEAILGLFTTAAKERSNLAHWVWGYAPQLPDAVLLAEPEGLIQFHAHLQQYLHEMRVDPNCGSRPPDFPRDNVLVYYERDFSQLSEQIQGLIGHIMKFRRIVSPVNGAQADEEFQQLSNEPAIQERVLRQRKRQKT